MKWITSTDIKQWADSRESQSLLPELILRLIRATLTDIKNIRCPSGDAVHLPGWDCVLESDNPVFNVPAGVSLWEFGVNEDPKKKADEDYNKRMEDALGYDRASSTFVFVTPRVWGKATEWVNDKKHSREWREIVVITAVELEDWLTLCPAVALWLAEKISGKNIKKAYDLESYWNRWATGNEIKLRPTLLLGGREKEQDTVYTNISKPSITIIQSIAQSESLAFAVACLMESPDNRNLLSRSVVVEDEDTLEKLVREYKGLIFIANVTHENHSYAIQNDHRIIYVISAAETVTTKNLIKLPLLDREKFIEALVESGLNKDRASQLSRETVRNITILRRCLELDYTTPKWAKSENIRDIIPAMLVARWTDDMEGDRELVSLVAGETYEAYIVKLQKWVNQDDSPIVVVGGKWRIYSPYETFGYAAHFLTCADFDRYKEIVNRITSDNDPDACEKMATTGLHFWEQKQKYSEWLKEGVYQTAIMISLIGDKKTKLTLSPSVWIDNMISSILRRSSLAWWFSNQKVLGLIAEASPNSYIEFIQKDLEKEDSIIKQLFMPRDSSGLFGFQENYVAILFSLQNLLWAEDLLLPVSCILVELCGIENDINLSNKPIEALRETYTIWCPQTYAVTQKRLQVLETLSKRYPSLVFDLYYKLLDGLESQTVFATHPMRWRCYNYEKQKITIQECRDSIQKICRLIISICDNSEKQICKLLKLASQLPLEAVNRKLFFDYVCNSKSRFKGNYEITNELRHTIYQNKMYPDAKWALPMEEIHMWESLLSELESDDLLEKYKWVFKDSYVAIFEIELQKLEWSEKIDKTYKYKNQIVLDIEKEYGFNGVCKFVKTVDCPNEVGNAYAYTADDVNYQCVLNMLLSEKEEAIIQFSKGFFDRYAYINGIESVIAIIKSLDITQYHSVIIAPLVSGPCVCRKMWTFIETLPKSIQDEYWEKVSIFHEYGEEAIDLIGKLIEYKYYDKAIDVVYYSYEKTSIPTNLIEKAIIGLLSLANRDLIHRMHYKLIHVVYILDKLEDADMKTLYSIEFLLYKFLPRDKKREEIKLIDEIMSDPHTMMNIIDKVYLSSDESERTIELEQIKNSEGYVSLCTYILFDIQRTPCVDREYNINSTALNDYIGKLQELGKDKHKIKAVNAVIGELLGNYPEIEGYPPIPICDIIERQNNPEINAGFKTRIYNKRGVTVRSALDGGTLENEEAQKYKNYADKIRCTHPTMCRIFDDLSREYHFMAKSEDIKVEIRKMEY